MKMREVKISDDHDHMLGPAETYAPKGTLRTYAIKNWDCDRPFDK